MIAVRNDTQRTYNMPWYEVAQTYETFIRNDFLNQNKIDEVWIDEEDWCYPCQEPKDECYCGRQEKEIYEN